MGTQGMCCVSRGATVLQLQREVSGAAASALAVVQVQHEQQLMAAKQEQEQLLQEAKQQVESLHKQLQDLQQQAVQQVGLVTGGLGAVCLSPLPCC